MNSSNNDIHRQFRTTELEKLSLFQMYLFLVQCFQIVGPEWNSIFAKIQSLQWTALPFSINLWTQTDVICDWGI